MDFYSLIAATTLLTASSNQTPLYDFTYSYYDSNSSIQTELGTHFYQPKYPEITLNGLTQFENSGLMWSLSTPYQAEKYSKGYDITGTLYKDYIKTKNTHIRLSFTFSSQSREKILPCEDNIGRLFHCYHGTQPSSQYFTYSYQKTRDNIYRKKRTFELTNINLSLIIIF